MNSCIAKDWKTQAKWINCQKKIKSPNWDKTNRNIEWKQLIE